MTAEEVDKYINQIAFSSAGEFLSKYKDKIGSIIGHFGLGFYSAFMVSKKVEIDSLSWKEGAKAVRWSCEGNPEYTMEDSDKNDRGTTITLWLDDDASEYATKGRIDYLLGKYCKFMPVPIVFGKEQEWKDGKYVDTDKDKIVNNIEPLWTKAPSSLKDEDYLKFYRALYPGHEDPLFWIHLNVDYPFTLTGILYFPKIKSHIAVEKNKIQLYCNQMFVTDHVEEIVPEFLTLLHGVIDSPDIPLNVSRSALQSDSAVRKISTYITKKVADRLEDIFKTDRADFEKKWDNLKLFMEYGMLTDEKFCERALKFALLKNTEGKFFSYDEYRKAVEGAQTDKDKKVVYLYATDVDEQYAYIEAAKKKGYDVLLMDCELDAHFVNLLEQKLSDTRFARVDSDRVDNLIPKEDHKKLEMDEKDRKSLEDLFKTALPEGNDYYVSGDNLGEDADPVLITQSEFMRRYRDMSSLGGGANFYSENPLVKKMLSEKDTDEGKDILHQITDLALLANGMLKGKALSDFISRSARVVGSAFLEKK